MCVVKEEFQRNSYSWWTFRIFFILFSSEAGEREEVSEEVARGSVLIENGGMWGVVIQGGGVRGGGERRRGDVCAGAGGWGAK